MLSRLPRRIFPLLVIPIAVLSLRFLGFAAAVLLEELQRGVILGGILELLDRLGPLGLLVLETRAKRVDTEVEEGSEKGSGKGDAEKPNTSAV